MTNARQGEQRLGPVASVAVWSVAMIDLVALAAVIAVDLASGAPRSTAETLAETSLYGLFSLFGLVGALIASRVPRNPIGWLILVAATMLTASIAVRTLSEGHVANLTTSVWVGDLERLSDLLLGVAIYIVLVLVPLLFPNGVLPSARWRLAFWFVISGSVIYVAGNLLRASNGTAGALSDGVMALAILLAVAAVAARYRSGDRTQRQQIKWFAAAAAVAAVGFLTSLAGTPLPLPGWAVFLLGVALLPVAIAIAVLRYRLYDIDRIISRTLTYAIVTASLALLFYGAVVVLQNFLAPLTREDTVAVAASTLAVAALFQPLRRRVQAAIDRRFNRARFDAERTVTAFTGRLRDQVDLDAVTADLQATVREAMRPATVSTWLRGPGA